MTPRLDPAVELPSVPVFCRECRRNAWHVFEGEPTEDGLVFVRLRCATAGCKGRTTRRWVATPAPAP